MKTYVVATGVVFGPLTLVHLWRIIEEPDLASDPWFILVTTVAAGLSVTAWCVARRPDTSG